MIQPLENGLNGSTRNSRGATADRNGVSSRGSGHPTYGDNHPTQTAGAVNLLEILSQMGMDMNAIQSLIALLSNIGGLEAKDYQDQLYQLLLKQVVTAEDRQYTRSVLEDQRAYDSPISQLARLTAAGIGRNAATGMLQGGTEPTLGQPAGEIPEVASPSDKAMQAAQTALDAIGMVGGLISLGFSAPSAIQQVKFMKNQNALNALQLSSYEDASAAFSILNAAGAGADAFGSVTNAAAAITNLAKDGNQDAKQFIAQGRLQRLQSQSYFSSPALSNIYRNERASSDYDKSFGLFVENSNAELDFKNADKRRVEQSILNLEAELQETIASAEFQQTQIALQEFHKEQLKSQTELLRKQGNLVEAQVLETKAKSNLLISQTHTNDLNNQLTQGIYDQEIDGKTGLDWLTQARATEIYNDCQKFITAKDKKIWEKEYNFIAANYDRLYQLELVRQSYLRGALRKYNTDPKFQDIIHICTAMQEAGAWDYMDYRLNIIKGRANAQGISKIGFNNDVNDLIIQ